MRFPKTITSIEVWSIGLTIRTVEALKMVVSGFMVLRKNTKVRAHNAIVKSAFLFGKGTNTINSVECNHDENS